ncbi:MAG: hypothetical protein HY716_06305 [Planctomycetes bacterium]|nr:hypothetical protein [Planctomycetota bacterium]
MNILLCAAVLAFSIQEEYRHAWSGFGIGSWMTYRNFEKGPKDERSSVIRMSLTKVQADQVTIRIEALVNGKPTGSRETPTSTKMPEAKRVREETLDIDGKSIACVLYEQVVEDKSGQERVRTWYSREIPGRIVKEESEASKGQKSAKAEGRISRIGQRVQIGKHLLTYAVYERTETYSDGRRVHLARWVSEEVPGFVIREEVRTTLGSAEKVTTRELLDFQVK